MCVTPRSGSAIRFSASSGSNLWPIRMAPPWKNGPRPAASRPATWNSGISQRNTLSALSCEFWLKCRALAKALRSVMMTPLDLPVVPEV